MKKQKKVHINSDLILPMTGKIIKKYKIYLVLIIYIIICFYPHKRHNVDHLNFLFIDKEIKYLKTDTFIFEIEIMMR